MRRSHALGFRRFPCGQPPLSLSARPAATLAPAAHRRPRWGAPSLAATSSAGARVEGRAGSTPADKKAILHRSGAVALSDCHVQDVFPESATAPRSLRKVLWATPYMCCFKKRRTSSVLVCVVCECQLSCRGVCETTLGPNVLERMCNIVLSSRAFQIVCFVCRFARLAECPTRRILCFGELQRVAGDAANANASGWCAGIPKCIGFTSTPPPPRQARSREDHGCRERLRSCAIAEQCANRLHPLRQLQHWRAGAAELPGFQAVAEKTQVEVETLSLAPLKCEPQGEPNAADAWTPAPCPMRRSHALGFVRFPCRQPPLSLSARPAAALAPAAHRRPRWGATSFASTRSAGARVESRVGSRSVRDDARRQEGHPS